MEPPLRIYYLCQLKLKTGAEIFSHKQAKFNIIINKEEGNIDNNILKYAKIKFCKDIIYIKSI